MGIPGWDETRHRALVAQDASEAQGPVPSLQGLGETKRGCEMGFTDVVEKEFSEREKRALAMFAKAMDVRLNVDVDNCEMMACGPLLDAAMELAVLGSPLGVAMCFELMQDEDRLRYLLDDTFSSLLLRAQSGRIAGGAR